MRVMLGRRARSVDGRTARTGASACWGRWELASYSTIRSCDEVDQEQAGAPSAVCESCGRAARGQGVAVCRG